MLWYLIYLKFFRSCNCKADSAGMNPSAVRQQYLPVSGYGVRRLREARPEAKNPRS